jgi:hypothetical protein
MSSNRFGTHNTGAAELVTYHSAYLEFLSIIRVSKQVAGLNHSEQNAFNGLNDSATKTECGVMALYRNALSHPYVAATHSTASLQDEELPSHRLNDEGGPFT